jgi:UBX domain-containing protein 7
MFSAPTYLFVGPFQAARQAAKDSKRWMLVNIQSDSDFACHALNRDVWKDEMVESLVQSGFIFWQQSDKSEEAKTYIERYQVSVGTKKELQTAHA